MSELEVMITCGANQAFTNVALCICNQGDGAIILAPYYFSHKLSLQLAGANIEVCPYDSSTFFPCIEKLASLIERIRPSVVVATSPNNPSGAVWPFSLIAEIVSQCKRFGSWLVVDETYHEILHGEVEHKLPCGTELGYDKIIHISSFSKAFGMAGWRVGYLAYPRELNENMRKIQDTIPTHTCVLSQKLAELCLDHDDILIQSTGSSFVQCKVKELIYNREMLWKIVKPLGTIKTYGGFYFLVPSPKGIKGNLKEDNVVDILATKFKVLVMPGSPFGAPGFLRISYGNISVVDVFSRLEAGFEYLQTATIL